MECLVYGIWHGELGIGYLEWGIRHEVFGMVWLLWAIHIVVGTIYLVRGVWYYIFGISMGCLVLGVCHGVDIIVCLM